MEITITENKTQKLVFELKGTDHTFCNALKDELRNDENVTVSTYSISHPLVGQPKFIIETKKGTKAKDSVEKAIERLKKKNAAFLKSFKTTKA